MRIQLDSEVLRKALQLHQKLMQHDLEDVVEKEATELEKRLAKARTKADGRKEEGKKRAKKNAAKRKRREYAEKAAPFRTLKKLQKLENEGWWQHLRGRMPAGDWLVDREDWDRWVSIPEGAWITLSRYNTKEPYTLSNMLVRESTTERVLFCGAEWKLKTLGYCL